MSTTLEILTPPFFSRVRLYTILWGSLIGSLRVGEWIGGEMGRVVDEAVGQRCTCCEGRYWWPERVVWGLGILMLSAAFTNIAKKRKLLSDFPFSSLPLQTDSKKNSFQIWMCWNSWMKIEESSGTRLTSPLYNDLSSPTSRLHRSSFSKNIIFDYLCFLCNAKFAWQKGDEESYCH